VCPRCKEWSLPMCLIRTTDDASAGMGISVAHAPGVTPGADSFCTHNDKAQLRSKVE
jgi:hypothetical protein